jgi:DNA-binding MarR family transcriptional regulator
LENEKGPWLIGRPSLKALFEGGAKLGVRRNRLIAKAVNEHGYNQVEVARRLKLHSSTVSRMIKSGGTVQE